MAVNDYLTPQERLNRIAQVVNKGIYLYYQKNNGKMEETSPKTELIKRKVKERTHERNEIGLDEKILTIEETAEFLSISRTTLWRLRKSKRIPFCIIGNRRLIRFKLSEVLTFLGAKSYL